MDIKILIAEDDPIFRELVCDILKKEGYIPIEACRACYRGNKNKSRNPQSICFRHRGGIESKRI